MISQDAHLFLLDDEGIVFVERKQALYELNTAATLIWCSLEEGEAPERAAAILAERADLAADLAVEHVAALIADWERLGLLRGSEPSVGPSGTRDMEADDLFVGDPTGFPTAAVPESACVYRIMDSVIGVTFGSSTQRDFVHPSLAHLEDRTGNRPHHRVDIVAGKQGHLILKDEKPVGICEAADRILPVVIGTLVSLAMDASRYFLQIHAGSVSNGEKSLLFPAALTSGKSTLVSGLMQSGFLFRSDEYAILDEEGLGLRTAAIPACLKEGAWPVVGAYCPHLADAEIHARADGKSVRYLPPTYWRQDSSTPEPVAAIIFPKYAVGAATTLTPMAKSLALRLFLEQCLAIPEWFDKEKVARLVGWLKATPCFGLELSDLQSAIELIKGRWGAS